MSYTAKLKINPANACQECVPGTSPGAWTTRVDGSPCTGGQCSGGTCPTILASGQNGPNYITLDANNVYWTTNGTVMMASKTGGGVVPLAMGQANAAGIAVNSMTVFWTTSGSSGAVKSVPLVGSTAVTTVVPNQSCAGDLVIDATSVYWGCTTTVMKASLTGTNPMTLATGQSSVDGIAVDGTNVYWADYNRNTIMKVALGGGTSVTLASGLNNPTGIAIDSAYVYWSNGGGEAPGAILKVPIGGAPSPTSLASYMAGYGPIGIAVDATDVYWTNYGASHSTVDKVDLAGTTVVTLARGQTGALGNPLFIAVDDTSIYWTDTAGGTVMKAPK